MLRQVLGRVFRQREFMKIWSAPCIYWSLVLLIFLIYILSITFAAIPLGIRPVTFQFVTLAAYVKYLNMDLIINT